MSVPSPLDDDLAKDDEYIALHLSKIVCFEHGWSLTKILYGLGFKYGTMAWFKKPMVWYLKWEKWRSVLVAISENSCTEFVLL